MAESTAEKNTESSCCDGKLGELWAAAEDCARRDPLKCSAAAFLAGVLFTILPVGIITAALVRISLALLRPLLMVLGAMKVLEEVEKRR